MDPFGDAIIGDLVEVPGGWHGTVMYVGPVSGRTGAFLGVDLIALDADKGRHDGTYNGISYFPTKSNTSGMFVPQGRCRVIDSNPRKERTTDSVRPSSRQLSIRPNSRMRSVSGRSFSGSQNVGSPPPRTSFNERTESTAAVQQKLLNENARLAKELEDAERRLAELQRAKAIQTHEMEELVSTVAELEALQGSSSSSSGVTLTELEELKAYIENREAKIMQLRSDAEVRRTEFRQVTEHQQATMEELKVLHTEQVDQMEQKITFLEGRLHSSPHDGSPTVEEQMQMNLLQDQLAELSEELDVLVTNQEKARQDIDVGNARIMDLELENERLHSQLAEARAPSTIALESEVTPHRVSRRVASIEHLPDAHPQKRQTIGFLETEIKRLQEENKALKLDRFDARSSFVPEATIQELSDLNELVLQLRKENEAHTDVHRHLEALRSELDRERNARRALEEQHDQMESTLERTIMELNGRSPISVSSPTISKTLPTSTRPVTPIPISDIGIDHEIRSPRNDRKIGNSFSQGLANEGEPASDGALWCEFCEQAGHDIISCKAVFGSADPTPAKPHNAMESRFDEDEMF